MYGKQIGTKAYAWVEFFMVTSICLMPYTAFKFIGPVGPSELLILMSAVAILLKNKGVFRCPKRLSIFTTTLRNYIIICFVGFCWNIATFLITGNLSSTIRGIAFDFFAYCFNLLTLYALEILLLNEETEIDAEAILQKVVNVNCFTMPLLFIISRFRRRLFGMPLRYYSLFTPFAENLHHTSMYLLPIVFLSMYFAARASSIAKKLIYITAAAAFAYFAIQTGSAKAELGVIAGAAISGFYLLTTKKGNINKNTIYLIALAIVICLVITLFKFDSVSRYAIQYFSDNDGGGARNDIWTHALQKWTKSPIVGFGPGAHTITSDGASYDAHNTFINTMLQAGVLGLGVYLYMWVKTIKVGLKNGYLLAMYITILIYSAGGDTLRRIPIWVFSVLAYYVLEKNEIQAKLK